MHRKRIIVITLRQDSSRNGDSIRLCLVYSKTKILTTETVIQFISIVSTSMIMFARNNDYLLSA